MLISANSCMKGDCLVAVVTLDEIDFFLCNSFGQEGQDGCCCGVCCCFCYCHRRRQLLRDRLHG